MKSIAMTLLLGVLITSSVEAQLGHLRPRIPDLDLDTLSGDVNIYYHKGYRYLALQVQSTIRPFRSLVRDSLGVVSRVDAVLLTLEDYDAILDLFPGYGPGVAFPTLDELFVMEIPPEESFIYKYVYRAPLAAASGAAGDSLDSIASGLGFASRDSVAYWLYSLAPVHEIGHLVAEDFFGGTPGGPIPDHHHKWLNEMSAEMLLYAFVTRFSPRLIPLYKATLLARLEATEKPPGDRNGMEQLKQCDAAYAEIWEGWSMGWCWDWWAVRGAEVFDELGFQFLRHVDQLVPWPETDSPYPSVEEMVAALEELEGDWMVWLDTDENDQALPGRFTLHPNYPNPFNPMTTITYDLRETADVHLTLHDALGKTIRTLDAGLRTPGVYSITLNATDLTSAVYFYRLRAGDFVSTKSFILNK